MSSTTPRRLVAILAALLGAAAVLVPVSAQAAVKGTYGIGVDVDTGDRPAYENDVITLKGRVTSGPVAGRSVTLYYRNSPTWKKIGTAKLTSRGTYSFRYRLRDGGNHRFRVVISRSREWKGRSIDSGLVPVLRFTPGEELADRPVGTASIDGDPYPDVITVANGESVTFDLAGKGCINVDFGVGAVDRTGVDAESAFGSVVIRSGGVRIGRVQPERDQDPVGFYAYPDADANVQVTAELDDAGLDRIGLVSMYSYCNIAH